MKDNRLPILVGAAALVLLVSLFGASTAAAAPQSLVTDSNQLGAPQLETADLHTPDDTIKQGNPGRISGSFVLGADADQPVKVQVTLDVPNNMYIEGLDDVSSGGSGLITNTFTVQPGEAKDISADVYGTEPGEHSVVGDITYFPEGNPDAAREIDGLTLTYNIEEPVPHDGNGEQTTLPFDIGDISVVHWLLGIVTVTVLGLLLVVARRTNIKIRK